MNQRLSEVLNGKQENYVLPFFWQHGASEETLYDYMEKIYGCGIRAVCVEARPHPDFVGPQWWHDMDLILDEAKKRDMKVWILDDAHFPTGYANGAAIHAPEHLKRWSLMERTIEVDGPALGCKFEVASHLGLDFEDKGQFRFGEPFREELVAVIAGRREERENGEVFYSELEDVTALVDEKGWIYRDFEEGAWCLFVYTKRLGAAAGQNDYISFLEKDSVRILIDTVYEPHYQHYKEYFGNVLAGFFSDEPGFYNSAENLYSVVKVGEHQPLPWTDDVAEQMKIRAGKNDLSMLPGLFQDLNGQERISRYHYMDIITRKYQENFSDQVGTWCREHDVEYIGHVLEDEPFSRSLGAGTGHVFRALHGQDVSGIDIVMNNLLPEHDYGFGSFNHYELAVIGASAAHQNEWMHGRAMCEVFGAFGWSEGLTLMKWITDHMLVNGINLFVPHAFSEKEFPDPDCPPHFYAHGKNPQFRHMHILIDYMNRASHLMSGGTAPVDTAVFFPAEGDWMGKAAVYGRLGKKFLQNQIPYEIICTDNLERAEVREGRICLGSASYKNLFVDQIEYLPEEVLRVFHDLKQRGAQIWYVGHASKNPEGIVDDQIPVITDPQVMQLTDESRNCRAASFEKWLRCYQYRQENLTVYMIANSSMAKGIETDIQLYGTGEGYERVTGYDALHNRLFVPQINADGSIHISLDKGESFFLLAGAADQIPQAEQEEISVRACRMEMEALEGPFVISTADHFALNQFEWLDTTKELGDIARKKDAFAGIIRYETVFFGKKKYLSLGRCYEGAEVWVNGQSAGTRITAPYLYEIEELTMDGENELRIEVATTLTNVVPDGLSMDRAVEPQGMFGPVRIN